MPASPPLPPGNARLLSNMGFRVSGRTGQRTFHAGMDLGHTQGTSTPVLNVQPGVVEIVARDEPATRAFSGYGNAVVVHHPADDTWALYAHLDKVDVSEGQQLPAGARIGHMGKKSNGRFPTMNLHLHLELRRRTAHGSSPFPGPYRTNNLDPREWLEAAGLRFQSRGGFEILPGSEMDATRSTWESLGSLALHRRRVALAGLGGAAPDAAGAAVNEYEPVRFDRDVRFGLTPNEWIALGTGTGVGLLGIGAMVYWRLRK